MKKIVAINLGSTSTKIAYYEDETCVFKDNIKHEASVIKAVSYTHLDVYKRQLLTDSPLKVISHRGKWQNITCL